MRSFILLWVVLACGWAGASIIEVDFDENTQGLHTAGLLIEWKGGFSAEFAVRFDEESLTGWQLLEAVETQTDLEVVTDDSGWGLFVDGLAYQGHSNQGYGGGDDWWHYWIQDGAVDWVSAAFGVSDRVLYDGYRDGWIYGRDTIPEPGTLGLLAVGLFAIQRHRRNTGPMASAN